MAGLPAKYQWLNDLDPLPKMVAEGLKLHGVIETPGPGNTGTIMAWSKAVGLTSTYTADSVPWCGLFMALLAKKTGRTAPAGPLWALNWAKFGQDGGQPELGDVLVFVRSGGGHVGLYIGEDASHYHVLGGNQSDSVCIARIAKTRLYAVRQPPYQNKPATARPYILSAQGAISTNEG
jgi:uncharacterized protein (TIGR02594 family)